MDLHGLKKTTGADANFSAELKPVKLDYHQNQRKEMVKAEAKGTWKAMGSGAVESYQVMANEIEAGKQAEAEEAKKAAAAKD